MTSTATATTLTDTTNTITTTSTITKHHWLYPPLSQRLLSSTTKSSYHLAKPQRTQLPLLTIHCSNDPSLPSIDTLFGKKVTWFETLEEISKLKFTTQIDQLYENWEQDQTKWKEWKIQIQQLQKRLPVLSKEWFRLFTQLRVTEILAIQLKQRLYEMETDWGHHSYPQPIIPRAYEIFWFKEYPNSEALFCKFQTQHKLWASQLQKWEKDIQCLVNQLELLHIYHPHVFPTVEIQFLLNAPTCFSFDLGRTCLCSQVPISQRNGWKINYEYKSYGLPPIQIPPSSFTRRRTTTQTLCS